jgi:alpha-D-ribose 1-methylphosphonate 5-triphosphate synthase subunit PhnI
MGYTTVRASPGAVSAAARLAQNAQAVGVSPEQVCDALGILVDQVSGEAGVWEPAVCARALLQAQGDVARAVSLVRAWAAMLPRLATARTALSGMRTVRRITPAFREPDGGQYLGASLDYAQRLLDLDDHETSAMPNAGHETVSNGAPHPPAPMAQDLRRALEGLELDGRVDPGRAARPLDRTRQPVEVGEQRGAFAQLLSRAETGTMTAMAYTAIRGDGDHPTLAELRGGELELEVVHPRSGGTVRVGVVPATVAEMVLYRRPPRGNDRRLTLGVGVTFGRLERRAIAAALLDANCAAVAPATAGRPAPAADEEFLTIALEGQEATGFLEHLKLPHHVTFTSTLDRLLADDVADDAAPEEDS